MLNVATTKTGKNSEACLGTSGTSQVNFALVMNVNKSWAVLIFSFHKGYENEIYMRH